jgi:hypothetical protein
VDALDVLADPQLAVVLVYVAPAQAEDFTAAQSLMILSVSEAGRYPVVGDL